MSPFIADFSWLPAPLCSGMGCMPGASPAQYWYPSSLAAYLFTVYARSPCLAHGSWTSFHILAFFVQTSRLFLSAWTGRTSLTRNRIPSKFRATVQSWIRGLAGSVHLNSPLIWLSAHVRTQFSLMISSRHCLISSSTSALFLPPCGLSLIHVHPSLMCQGTIPLSVERFTCTPNVSATNSNLLPHPQKHGPFALCVV